MPPKSKMNTKSCPDCDQPNAVASKTCVCGYSFYLARRNETTSSTSKNNNSSTNAAAASVPESETGEGVRQRRTQRVKEKPNYYDATEFMKEKRKRRRSRPTEDYELRRGVGEPTTAGGLKRKRRRKVRTETKEREEEEEVLPIGTSPEKTAQCTVILAELNRRMYSAAVRVR